MSEAKHALQTLALTRQDAQVELTDFIRTRTELECTIEDLRAADANAGGKCEELERDLANVEGKIAEREHMLDELLPEWEAQRAQETTEKRRLDEASARLAALFAKQGRATKFRTKAERDTFLKHEIASMKAYQTTQNAALATTRTELETVQRGVDEIDAQITAFHGKIEDGRKRMRDLAEESAGLKDKHSDFVERRKDLWREDTKLDSLVSRAADELRTAERALAGMMDKVYLLETCQWSEYRLTV